MGVSRSLTAPAAHGKWLGRVLESKLMLRLSGEKYREHVREHYDGRAGALLATASLLSLHSPLTGRLLRRGKFETCGCKRILDLGSGAGQILTHLLRYAPVSAELYAVDLSLQMLRRARNRLERNERRHRVRRLEFTAADITRLPFGDDTFDAITCGWVVEHLPDPRPGLREMARVLAPNGRLLLLATEDTLTGALCSRTWKCRTYNRRELREACSQIGLAWTSELWFSRLHRALGIGGILVEAQKHVISRGDVGVLPTQQLR